MIFSPSFAVISTELVNGAPQHTAGPVSGFVSYSYMVAKLWIPVIEAPPTEPRPRCR